MTKEELEKEAEEYAKQNNPAEYGVKATHWTVFNAYLAGAEPREKQIQALGERCLQLQKDKGNLTDKVTELEAQIEKMKCCENCRYCNEWGEANSNSPNCKKCNWVSNWKLRR